MTDTSGPGRHARWPSRRRPACSYRLLLHCYASRAQLTGCIGRDHEVGEVLLVARDGVAALSVRGVAAAVGTSTRAVYSVFGSKEALVRGLATHAFELLMQAVDAIPLTEDPLADLHAALVSGFRPFVLKHPDLFRLAMLWSPVTPDAGVFEASDTAFSRLELRVERVRAVGLLPDRSSREVAFELAAVGNALANLEVCGMPPGVDADRIWNHTVGDVLRGLCADGREHNQPEGV